MTDLSDFSFYHRNCEGLATYDLPEAFWKNRRLGLSAMLRVKNEEGSIAWCLESIKDIFDEIIIVLQNSSDRTEEVIAAANHPNLRTYHYPFDSYPNGPGHDRYPRDSVRTRAYFYNWTLAKTTREWVCKWDGDMVAMDHVGARLKAAMVDSDIVSFRGVNLVGEDLSRCARRMFTASEPRLFRVSPRTYYYSGKTCELFSYPHAVADAEVSPRVAVIEEAAFVHLKWTKPESSITQAWPKDWEKHPHFRKLIQRGGPGEVYLGPYPEIIRRALGLSDDSL